MNEQNSFSPYVGLQPFSESNREYFFGRDREQRIIASNLYAAPLTVLYGASGVGKSSILLAGVLPRLRAAPRTAVVVFRAWQDESFLLELKKEIQRAVETTIGKPLNVSLALPLDDYLYHAAQSLRGSILILIDQFEEYFLYHPDTRDNRFDEEFARAINREDVDAEFLIALREDGLSKLDRFRARIPNLLGNTLRLNHLDAHAAEDAIRKPLDVYNAQYRDTPMTIEPELVAAIIEQVRSGAVMFGQAGRGADAPKSRDAQVEIETPFLQLVMTRLWDEERHAGSNVLQLSTLQKLGGAEHIVRSHLDQVMVRLNAAEQDVCALFFDRLVTPTGTKIAQAVDDLVAYAAKPKEFVTTILKTLADARVLRSIAPPPEQPSMIRYEIFHDVIAPAILDWRRRFVAKQEAEHARKEERERRLRLIRRIAVTAGAILLFVFAGLTLIAIRQTLYAQAAETEAETQRDSAVQARATSESLRQINYARQLAFTAIGELQVDPERSILLAVNSLNVADTLEGQQALHKAIIESRVRRRLDKHTAEVWGANFSPDGKTIVTASRDKTARVWDVATGNSVLTLNHPAEVYNAAYSPDGKKIVTAGADGIARIFDASDATRAPILLRGHSGALWVAGFSPDGKQIVTASSDKTARVFDATTGDLIALFNIGSEVHGASFSPDGKLIVTASNDN
ncbi:MAG: PD40 domain-containing protein, partial [Chloroflexi bacterium]|nr:PD40 domain-containing protein [Chloroflexota bacterium]